MVSFGRKIWFVQECGCLEALLMNFSFCNGRADYRLSYFEKVSFPPNSSIIKQEDVVSEEKDNIT